MKRLRLIAFDKTSDEEGAIYVDALIEELSEDVPKRVLEPLWWVLHRTLLPPPPPTILEDRTINPEWLAYQKEHFPNA